MRQININLICGKRFFSQKEMEQISAENQKELNSRYKTTAIIVGVQILSTILLIVVAWFLSARDNSITQEAASALWMMVLFIAVGTFVLRRFLFSWERLKSTALLKGIQKLISSLQTNTIILCAFAEIIAIIGFLVATLNGNKFEMFRAGAVALIVFLINFPRKSVWEKIVANLENV